MKVPLIIPAAVCSPPGLAAAGPSTIRLPALGSGLLLCCCVSSMVLHHGFSALIASCWCAGVKGRRIRELTSVVQKRFKFPDGSVELYAEKVNNRGLCAIAQAESLRYKLLGGLAVRR